MRDNKYTIRVFDGAETFIYTTEAIDIRKAEDKILGYHMALGRTIVKVITTERKG